MPGRSPEATLVDTGKSLFVGINVLYSNGGVDMGVSLNVYYSFV